MSFRIVSGDISTDYKLFDTVLIADGRPPIASTKCRFWAFRNFLFARIMVLVGCVDCLRWLLGRYVFTLAVRWLLLQ